MTENEKLVRNETEAIECLKSNKPTSGYLMLQESIDMAIKALEEVQHWHTSVINPKIKNVFANSSTQICQNCDHKDEYIEELKAEVEEYRTIGTPEELKAAMKYVYLAKKPGTVGQVIENCVKYEEIGTLEECRAAVEKQKAKKPDYEGDGYSDGHLVYDTWICPCCSKHYEVDYDDYDYCPECGQHIDWSDEE